MPSVSAWPTRPSIALCDRAALWGARVNAVARSAIGIAVARTAVATRRPQGSLPSSATSPSAAIATGEPCEQRANGGPFGAGAKRGVGEQGGTCDRDSRVNSGEAARDLGAVPQRGDVEAAVGGRGHGCAGNERGVRRGRGRRRGD